MHTHGRRIVTVSLIVSLAVSLAGCVAPGAKLDRDRMDFPVVSSVAGVSNATGGDVALAGADGVLVAADAANATVRIGLGPVVNPRGIVQACRDECEAFQTREGMVIAEGSLISFNNLSLNALGPDGDAVVFFFDEGRQNGQFLRWFDEKNSFQLSGDVETLGEIRAASRVGTVTRVGDAEIVSSALVGLEDAVFLRGTGRFDDNGTATIAFPPAWSVLVGDGIVTAQVTLTSRGPAVFVSEKSGERITVETVTGESSNATFDWFVQAPRVGGENFEPIR